MCSLARAPPGHGHGGDDAKCEDADCKDASHDHAHGHGHGHGGKKKRLTHKEKYGISTFVYSRRRPFHPIKLSQIIKQLPVSVNQALGISDSKVPLLHAGPALPSPRS